MSNYYPIIKHLHMICAAISISLLIARFICLRLNASVMRQKWVRIVPHCNDTVLFCSGVTLIFLTAQYPLTPQSLWLTEKLGLLLVYILLGFIALRRKPLNSGIRYGAFLLALACFASIYYLAKTKAAF